MLLKTMHLINEEVIYHNLIFIVKNKSLHLTQNRNCKELDVNEENFFYSFYHGQVPTVQQYKNL